MKNIIALLGKKRKEVVKYLDENNIAHKKIKHHQFALESFDYQSEGDTFEVRVQFVANVAVTLACKMHCIEPLDDTKALELLAKYRNYFAEIATVQSDNTNNPAREYYVNLDNERVVINIGYIINPDEPTEPKTFAISLSYNKPLNDNPLRSMGKMRYLIYLVAGIVWGLMMFLLTGIDAEDGYSPINFAICMGGGLFFTLLFGVALEITQRIANKTAFKPKEFLPEHNENFVKLDTEVAHEQSFCGVLHKYSARAQSVKQYVAKFYLQGSKIIVAYLDGKKIKLATLDVQQVYDMFVHFAQLKFDKSNNCVILLEEEERNKFLQYADKQLCHDVDKLATITQGVEKQFAEYDPFSIYTYQKEHLLSVEIPLLSRRILHAQNPTLDQLKLIMCDVMDDAVEAEVVNGQIVPTLPPELNHLAELIYQNVCLQISTEEIFSF